MYRFRRVATVVLVVGGFFALWFSIFSGNETWESWIVWGIYALLVLGFVLSAIRASRESGRLGGRDEASSYDTIQGMYQGRRPPTFYKDSVDASSQIAGPPHRDPLKLPPKDQEKS